jgi:hypothetical protein
MTDSTHRLLGEPDDPDGFDRLTATMHGLVHWFDQPAGSGDAAVGSGADAGPAATSGPRLDDADLVAFGTGWRPESIGFEGPDEAETAAELAERIGGEISDTFTPKFDTADVPGPVEPIEPVDVESEFARLDEADARDRDLAEAFDEQFGDGDGDAAGEGEAVWGDGDVDAHGGIDDGPTSLDGI